MTNPTLSGTNADQTYNVVQWLSSIWFELNESSPPVTPVAGSATSITTGGTAVTVFAANTIVGGAFIVNPIEATESLFVDMVNSPSTTAPGTSGTTIELLPGQAFSVPSNCQTIVYANGATSGHTFTAVRF